MASSLTSVAISTRKSIRYGIFFIIFLTISRILLGFAITIYNTAVPKPPPPPTVRFGRLPTILFPKLTQQLPTMQYKLDTITGGLPSFPTQAKVYSMPPYATTLVSSDDARRKATALGFTSEPIELSNVLYRYASTKVPSTLEMNIVNGAFSISYNLAADSSPLSDLPPSKEVAVASATQILSQAGIPVTDLNGEAQNQFLKVEGQNLVRAISLSEADLTLISLMRHDVDKLPSVTADPFRGNVWLIFSGARERDKQIVAAQYRHFQLDETRFETYPIKTAQQAFEDLKNGKGYIANLGLNVNGEITIRSVSLAYYDPDTVSSFYQPVIVFKGDGEFVAYVPAVTSAFYTEASPAPTTEASPTP